MNETKPSSGVNRWLYICLFACYLFNVLRSGFLVPLYNRVVADVVTQNTYLPDVMEFLCSFVELGIFFLTYAVLLYSRSRFGLRAGRGKILLAGGAVVVKYTVNLLSSWIEAGFSSRLDYQSDIIISLLSLLLELTQLFAVLLIAELLFRRAEKRNAATDILPCRKWNDLQNPILQSAFGASAVMAGVRVISRIIYDIHYCIYISNTFTAGDILAMILYYAGDLLVGVVFYFLLLLIFNLFYIRELKEIS